MKIAIIGAGHLGRFHVQQLASMEDIDIVAVVDTDASRRAVADEYGVPFQTTYDDLAGKVDGVVVVVPTTLHYEIGAYFLSRGVPCMIEKPLAATVEQARELTRLADENNVILQVGHVERFNPVLRAVEDMIHEPKFIEVQRISPYPFRGADVGVVMDLMIHDIDIILHLVDRPLLDVRASAVEILSTSEDIANARLEFDGGCVANVTASRVAIKKERRIRIFQYDSYLSLDLLAREANVFRKRDKLLNGEIDPGHLTPEQLGGMDPMTFALTNLIEIKSPNIHRDANPLYDETRDFCDCIRDNRPPLVSGRHGAQAIEVAGMILDDIARRKQSGAE